MVVQPPDAHGAPTGVGVRQLQTEELTWEPRRSVSVGVPGDWVTLLRGVLYCW